MTGFLARNWVWIVFLVVMVAMHRRGYGCGMHGHHGGHHDEQDRDRTDHPAGHSS